jgi:hypothetical protein
MAILWLYSVLKVLKLPMYLRPSKAEVFEQTGFFGLTVTQ